MRISDWSSDVCSSDLQLVDREDPSVGAGHEAVVQRELVGEVAALGHLDRVDLADEVGDRCVGRGQLLSVAAAAVHPLDRSEEHTSELQSLMRISYAVFCLKKKKITHTNHRQQPHHTHIYSILLYTHSST